MSKQGNKAFIDFLLKDENRLVDIINATYYGGKQVLTKEQLKFYDVFFVTGEDCIGIQLVPKDLRN